MCYLYTKMLEFKIYYLFYNLYVFCFCNFTWLKIIFVDYYVLFYYELFKFCFKKKKQLNIVLFIIYTNCNLFLNMYMQMFSTYSLPNFLYRKKQIIIMFII